jgi:hypothetical protein
MQTASVRFRVWSLFLLLPLLNVQANPEDDAVAAVLKLRGQQGYSWETITTRPGTATPAPPRSRSGAISADGDMAFENTWADGRVVRAVSRRNGDTVVRSETGWISKSELAELSRKRGSPQATWSRLAITSLEAMTPEEELTRLLNDCTSYTQSGDRIEAVLTERGASFWLGSGRLIRRATGTMHLRIRDGLIRECHISAEGNKVIGADGDKTVPVEFESTTTFNYSARPDIPDEARQKLDALSRR